MIIKVGNGKIPKAVPKANKGARSCFKPSVTTDIKVQGSISANTPKRLDRFEEKPVKRVIKRMFFGNNPSIKSVFVIQKEPNRYVVPTEVNALETAIYIKRHNNERIKSR